jgi:hypothetical protein
MRSDRDLPADAPGLAHRYRLVYAEGKRSGKEPALAEAAIVALGQWDEAVLWVSEWGIWPSSENWPRYYQARGERGERMSLAVKPGHWFAAAERSDLVLFLTLVLEQAWGGYVLVADAGHAVPRRLVISHDEWIELQAGEPSRLGPVAA